MRIGSCHPFRVTRNADTDVDDSEDDDLLAAVEFELRRRRFGRAVRLEVGTEMPPDIVEFLRRELELGEVDVYRPRRPARPRPALVDRLARPPRPRHAGRSRPSTPPAAVDDRRRHAGRHLRPAARAATSSSTTPTTRSPPRSRSSSSRPPTTPTCSPSSRRCTGPRGTRPFVAALVRRRRGRQAGRRPRRAARPALTSSATSPGREQLEEAGVHVVYGVVGLKTHSKMALVVRREADGIRRYCHVGTGNYNPDTARIYEDLGLLTADPVLGEDLTALFNHLTGFSRSIETRQLIVAPTHFRPWALREIARQRDARRTGPHLDQDERPHRPRRHRRPLRGLPGRGAGSSCWSAGCAVCVPGSRGSPRTSR